MRYSAPLLIVLCSLIMTRDLSSQNEDTSIYQFTDLASALEMRYDGGSKAFYNNIYQQINYPKQARSQCISGKIVALLQISKEGSLKKISLLNKIPIGGKLDEEAINLLLETGKNWLPGEKDIETKVSFVFRYEGNEEIEGDLQIVAYFTTSNSKACSISRKVLLKKMNKFEKKNNFTKAISYCEELLKHYPEEKYLLDKYSDFLSKK